MSGVFKLGGKTVATHDESTDVVSLASDVDISNLNISNNDFSNVNMSNMTFPAGHILQVVTRNNYTGFYTGSNNTWQDLPDYTISITPKITNSNLHHFLTVGFLFDCDGGVSIRTDTYRSHSIGDTFRGWSARFADDQYDMCPFTVQWLDTNTHATNPVNYTLTAAAFGCNNLWSAGTSNDFQPYWTIMEIAK